MKKILSRLVMPLLLLGVVFITPGTAHAACSAPTTTYGTITSTISVPATATYRIWTRMMAPDATNNTYALEVDGGNCYTVGGGSSVTPNAWVWVDFQGGTTTNKVQQSLTAGNHTLKMIGLAPNVKLDKITIASDLGCVLTDSNSTTGCVTPTDITAPQVSMTAPTNGAVIKGQIEVAATASDDVGVTRVDFYSNGQVIGTKTTAPYTFNWDTSLLPNGSYTVGARAYDQAGNWAPATHVIVTVNNAGDTSAPTTPQSVTAAANAYNKVTVNWAASTDNVGVTGYTVYRNGLQVAQLGKVTSYADTSVMANTTYNYTVKASDAAGNTSPASSAATVKTPNIADSQAPTAPGDLAFEVVSWNQVNMSWAPSTDNTGVTAYDVYRNNAKIATVSTTSFGDTGLAANTKYDYYVVARDAASNTSKASPTEPVTTPAKVNNSDFIGYVRTTSGSPIKGAIAETYSNGRKVRAATGANGFYEIDPISSGSHSITYTASGYKPLTSWRNIGVGLRIANNVNLQRQ